MYTTVCTQGDFTWAEMRRKLSSHSAQVWLYITGGNTEKGVKQGKSSYLLLSMKKDQANKTNVERVYRWQPLAWEPGPNRSSIDLQLVQEWVQCTSISCTSMLWSWSRGEEDGVGGGQRWVEKGKGGDTMRSPPSYGGTAWSGVGSPRCWRWHKVVRVEVEEVHGALGCWR